MPISEHDTVGDARDYVERGLKDGVQCHCCKQNCKLYKRRIYSTMAVWLIWRVREFEIRRQWVDIRESPVRGGDYAKLAYWKLAYSEVDYNRKKGIKPGRTGIWAPTNLGIAFARGETTVSRHVYVFNQEVYRRSAEHVTILDCLGTDFDYHALWQGYW